MGAQFGYHSNYDLQIYTKHLPPMQLPGHQSITIIHWETAVIIQFHIHEQKSRVDHVFPLQCVFGIISMKLFVTPVQSIHLKTMLSLYIPVSYKLFHHIMLRVTESYQLYMHA